MNEREYEKRLPLLAVVNNRIDGVIRWCTPSIHPRVPQARGIYENDMSISYHALGNPALNTGVFGRATKLAAAAYGAMNTLFSVNGSSGSNFMLMRALKHQLGEVHVLAQRNVHKSIGVAAEDYGINVVYLEPKYDDTLQIFVPNPIEDFVAGLKANPKTNVVLVTNPTYEGLSLDLKKLVRSLKKINSDLIIYVDEAWGAHFPFSERLPESAMAAGADLAVHSVHKLGSGLQQTSLIHWQGNRIDSQCVRESYKALITTSPSFHLLASLDAARYFMETYGEVVVDELIETADSLRQELVGVNGIKVVFPQRLLEDYEQVADLDRTKVLINVAETGLSGCEIAHYLESEYKVVVEKYEAENILFIATFQNTVVEARQTAYLLAKAIDELKAKAKRRQVRFPEFPREIVRKMPAHLILTQDCQVCELEKAIGKVVAEDVVPYPPGIPMIAKGEVVSREHVEYLKAIKKTDGLMSVVMVDQEIETLSVVSN